MPDIDVVSLISRWLHILSAMVLAGGAVYIRVALLPTTKSVLSPDMQVTFREQLAAKWKMVVHSSAGLLLLTGAINYMIAISDSVSPMPYHPIFMFKVLMGLTVIFLAIALSSSSPGFAKLRENSARWLKVSIMLVVLIVLLSGALKSFHQKSLIDAAKETPESMTTDAVVTD